MLPVNYEDRNFYRNLFKELYDAQDSDATAISMQFQEGSVLVSKIDESKWTIFDLQEVSSKIDELVEKTNSQFDKCPKDIQKLSDFEDMLDAFKKIAQVVDKLYKETLEIIIKTVLVNTSFEQVDEILSNHKTFFRIQGLVEKIENIAFGILEKNAPDVDWRKSTDKYSFLHEAILSGKKELALSLIENGADLEAHDLNDNTPLLSATRFKEEEIAKALLAKGADPKKENEDGYTALHFACEHGLDIVDDLLNRGVDPNVANDNEITPIFSCCEGNNVKAFKLLLAKGANINQKDTSEGQFAFHWACIFGSLDIVRELFQHPGAIGQLEIVDNNGDIPLDLACEKGHLEIYKTIFEELVKRGADLEKQKQIAKRALHKAIWGGHIPLVQYLVDNEAKNLINDENEKGETALHIASRCNRIKVVHLLAAKGADLNKKDRNGKTALHIACDEKNRINTAQTLLESGAALDVQDKQGRTPLICVLQKGFVELARLLLDKGADVSKQSNLGDTALSLCLEKLPSLLNVLFERKVPISHFLKFRNGSTALHELFSNPTLLEPEKLAELFLSLSKTGNVCAKDINKKTPLQCLMNLSIDNLLNQNLATQLVKLIFCDFTAIENVIDDRGINALINHFREHPEELISNPQNERAVNPFAVALLFDSGPLAYEIACKLNTNEFLNKCQELEKSYPQTPVLQFFFETFICNSSSYQKPLPKGHIQALFSYVSLKLDVTQRDEAGKTPLFRLLLEREQSAASIIVEILGKFRSISEDFLVNSPLHRSLISELVENPLQLFDALQKNSLVNPLEVAFLFGSIELARAIASTMTKKRYQALALELEKKFPQSKAHEFLFNVEFSIAEEHFAKGVTVIPKKPQGIEVRELLAFYDKVNFENANAPLYFDPKVYGLSSDEEVRREVLIDFIEKIEQRKEYLGTPKQNSPAIKVFYQIIENAVTGVIETLKSVSDEKLKAQTIIDFLKDVTLCGGRIFAVSVEIYNKVIHNIEDNFENRVLTSLGELRGFFAHDVIPKSEQSVHDYNRFVRIKGERLGLPGSVEGAQFDDIYVGSETFKADDCEEKFLELYTPSQIAFKWLMPQLKNDHTLREKYTSWFKCHVPKEWGHEKYNLIKEQLLELERENASPKKIALFLENNDIYFDKTKSYNACVEDVRGHDFIEHEVYEDLQSNTFKLQAFAASLVKIEVLKEAVDFVPENKALTYLEKHLLEQSIKGSGSSSGLSQPFSYEERADYDDREGYEEVPNNFHASESRDTKRDILNQSFAEFLQEIANE